MKTNHIPFRPNGFKNLGRTRKSGIAGAWALCLLLGASLSACDSSSSAGASALATATAPAGSAQSTSEDSPRTESTATAKQGNPDRTWSTDAMVFAGSGTWTAEVASLEAILKSHGATYREVSSAQLDSMSVDDIAKFGVLIFPGGDAMVESDSLSSDTHARLREAVQVRGVSYLGFCAGAFMAVAPKPAAGKDVSYGVGVVDGKILDYYYLENTISPDIAVTTDTFADGSKHDLVWYGGPVTPNFPGGVIARYPNGDPAISETWSGNGFVILSGPHPAAPQSTRDAYGLSDADGTDFDVAWDLIEAAIHQAPLAAF